MGIHTKAVNVYGAKYDLDAYNDRVRTESENELIELGRALGKNYSDYPLYYDDEDKKKLFQILKSSDMVMT